MSEPQRGARGGEMEPEQIVEEPVVEGDDEGAEEQEPQGGEMSDDARQFAEVIMGQIGDQVNSIVDRRVTSLMNTLQNDYGLSKQRPRKPAFVPNDGKSNAGDRIRFVKAAIAEELGLIDWADKDEHRAARTLAFAQVEGRSLDPDMDDYEIAEAIVTGVQETLTRLKGTYQTQQRRELERRGVLRDDPEERPTGQRRGGSSNDPQRAFDKGAELAKKKFADRMIREE